MQPRNLLLLLLALTLAGCGAATQRAEPRVTVLETGKIHESNQPTLREHP
jgi:hypothetical protein